MNINTHTHIHIHIHIYRIHRIFSILPGVPSWQIQGRDRPWGVSQLSSRAILTGPGENVWEVHRLYDKQLVANGECPAYVVSLQRRV